MNTFLYKFLDSRNRPVTIVTKFIFGMIFACISMCLAGSIEVARQNQCVDTGFPGESFNSIYLVLMHFLLYVHVLGNSTSTLTIFAQLPQEITLGLSEMLIVMASYEFAFYAAPRSAQSLFMSFRFCSLAIASFIGAAYIASFSTNSAHTTSNFSVSTISRQSFSLYLILL